MIKLTRTEITWIINELNTNAAVNTNAVMSYPNMNNIEKGLLTLKSEQLTSISNKLQKALNENNKRIEIK